MHTEWIARLSDYIDDELAADERQLVEDHLDACPECARAAAELRAIAARAAQLTPIPPSRDLWEGIEARIAAPPAVTNRRRFSFTVPQLLAASVALAVLSGAAALRLRPAHYAAEAVVGQSASPSPRATGVERAAIDLTPERSVDAALLDDAAYDRLVADLERTLEKGRGALDPSTIAVVEENLAIIDQAAQEARQALREDPANAYLNGHVAQTRQRKIDLLRQATALALDTN